MIPLNWLRTGRLAAMLAVTFGSLSLRAANVTLSASDAYGSSSFNAAGNWNNSAAPAGSNSYYTSTFTLRSPANATAYAFAGGSLSIDSGGRFLMKGTGGQILTVGELILNGGLADVANGSDNDAETLAGSIVLNAGTSSYMGALSSGGDAETLLVTAPISGTGSLQIAGASVNAGADNGAVIFTGTNTYTGNTLVAGGTLLVNGPFGSSNIAITNGATLGGTGSISGTITVRAGGKLAPGIPALGAVTAALGTLTATNAVSIAGTVLMKINRSGMTNSDRLAAPGLTLNSGATLTVTNIGSAKYAVGDTFTLFSTPVSGSFSVANLPPMSGPGLGWSNSLAANGAITIVPVAITNVASITNATGLGVTLDTSGFYTVQASSPAWTFIGSLGTTPTGVATNSGLDNVGAYSEMTFNYVGASGISQTAGIRLYSNSPSVLFTHTYLAASTNDLAFPKLTTYPANLYQIGYNDVAFATYGFGAYVADSPWVLFDTNFNSFVISPATNYMIARDFEPADGSLNCGINAAITNLPAGFTHRAILVVQPGINNAFNTWGNILTGLSGKTRPANNAAIELQKLGYWTDNGANYYYSYVSNLGYAGTLLAVKNEFASNGLSLGYMQLDSWWYPKGASDSWQGDPTNSRGGIYQYVAAPALFSNGLSAFQQQLGLPLATHCRWIDPASPYNSQYTMSGEVCVDPRYWTNIMAYLKNGGVATFEHDWLSGPAVPLMNLNDPGAFMNDMAAAASSNGLNMQYCMPEPRHYLQSSLYNNLLTTRVCNDHFTVAANGIGEWDNFIYDSRLAGALGEWPWTDVYNSVNLRDLLIGTLSAGPVGVGDALGAESFTNLLQSVRQDSVMVKPDGPLLALDQNYVNDAQGLDLPMVASTYTDHNGLRNYYVFAYARTAANTNASFSLGQLGLAGSAYVYDYFNQTGMVVSAGSTFNFSTTVASDVTGGSYFIVSPIGASGIGLIGDNGKFVTAGKNRIVALTDTNGIMQTTVTFAAGESNVTLTGYAAFVPAVSSSAGSAVMASYGGHQFTIRVSPGSSGTATVQLSAAANNLPQVNTPASSASGTVYAGTNIWFTETLSPPWNDPPFTYQWQVNGVNFGSATSSATASNSIAVDTTGLATGAYLYRVIVSNVDGAVTSAPVTLNILVPGPATNFTLNYGGSPVVEASGSDWDMLDAWNPGGAGATSSEFSYPGSTFEVVVGSRLRTPAGNASNVFPGSQLIIDGSGIFENATLNNVGELRIKNNNSSSTLYVNKLVLNGGQLDLGDNTLAVIQGELEVASNSVIYIDSSGADRSYQIASWLTGTGNIFWHQFDGTLGGAGLEITGTSNTFQGQWIVDQGALVGAAANSLGTNNIVVGTNGLVAALETLYDVSNPWGSLVLGANARMLLHQSDRFASVTVNGASLTKGAHTFAQLNAAYPAIFPASWSAQLGSSYTNGSGQILVGPLLSPRITSIGLSGMTLSIAATNGSVGGTYCLLTSTNLTLPWNQWTPVLTNSLDGNGNLNLTTNIVNPSDLLRYYILLLR